jgi:hypothetical protein
MRAVELTWCKWCDHVDTLVQEGHQPEAKDPDFDLGFVDLGFVDLDFVDFQKIHPCLDFAEVVDFQKIHPCLDFAGVAEVAEAVELVVDCHPAYLQEFHQRLRQQQRFGWIEQVQWEEYRLDRQNIHKDDNSNGLQLQDEEICTCHIGRPLWNWLASQW